MFCKLLAGHNTRSDLRFCRRRLWGKRFSGLPAHCYCWFIFIFAILASPHLMLPGIDILSSVLWQYFPLMIAYTIWGLYLYEIFSLAHNKKPEITSRAWWNVAEREGFEPSKEVSPLTRLAGERLQPARPSLHFWLIRWLVKSLIGKIGHQYCLSSCHSTIQPFD